MRARIVFLKSQRFSGMGRFFIIAGGYKQLSVIMALSIVLYKLARFEKQRRCAVACHWHFGSCFISKCGFGCDLGGASW